MKHELNDYHRNTPNSELIADLLRVASELHKGSVTIEEYNEMGKYHSTTLSRRFGSWFKALEKVGLSKTRNLHITNEQYFENLEKVWSELGRQPKYADILKPFSKYSVGAYEYRFGSWRKALEQFISFIEDDKINSVNLTSTTLNSIGNNKHITKRNINWRLRFKVMQRDKFKCVKCGRTPATNPSVVLHVDHITPWSKGGETIIANLQTLCSICNIGKSDLFE
jgi:hypothetical protein